MESQTDGEPCVQITQAQDERATNNTMTMRRSKPGTGGGSRISFQSKGKHVSERVKAVLQQFDVNQDDALDIDEVCQLVEHMLNEDKKHTYLKYAFGGLMLFTLLLLGSMFGLTWAVVASLKDTEIQGNVLVTKEGQSVQVASSEYLVGNGSLMGRGANNTDSPIRTNTFVGSPYNLSSGIDMASLMELKHINLKSGSIETSIRVDGVTKNGDAVTILTPVGSMRIDVNSTTYDNDLAIYLSSIGFQIGSNRKLLAPEASLNGYFGYIADPSETFDDGSWWKVEATDKSQAKQKNAKLKKATDSSFAKAWANYKAHFQKSFDPSTDARRFAAFKQNLREIAKINDDESLGYWASGNAYTDMDFTEFKNTVLMRQLPNFAELPPAFIEDLSSNERRKLLQSSVDWRASGKVSPVKDQGGCGCCWAFAGVAAIESAVAIATNSAPPDLSEQQLVSCVTTSYGCNGGSSWDVINYVISNNITYENRYPYVGTAPPCDSSINKQTTWDTMVKLSGMGGVVTANSETSLIAAVARQPVVTYMMVDSSFMSYAGGVYSSSSCTTAVNHAMTIVGYDSSNRYWIVLNSWGAGWGQAGYSYVRMTGDGTPGMCGIYQYNYYPPLTIAKIQPPPPPRPPPSPSGGGGGGKPKG
jgi:C1A family cysteine protease